MMTPARKKRKGTYGEVVKVEVSSCGLMTGLIDEQPEEERRCLRK